jgi:perosamine synthetase
MVFEIPLFEIYWDEEDIKSVNEVIRRGTYWATGPEIEQFEDKLSEYIGLKHAVTFNSGTSALHAVLLAHGIKSGNEVIVPSFTFTSTANAPIFVGATPVFAEIEEKTYGLDPEEVEEKITPKTKAIIPIHYGGCPCMIEELAEIAEDYNLILIEDAAESLGSKVNNRSVGSFGDTAMFSFCQNKIITTGEGGCIVTDSGEIYDKLKLIRSHGRLENVNYFSSPDIMDYKILGYNFRMSTMTAALGISQLKKINKIINLRRNIAAIMTKKLSKINEIILPSPPTNYFSVYQMYTIRVAENIRNDLINHLTDRSIMSKIYFPPIHLTSFYKEKFGYDKGNLPITEKISDQVISLPIYPNLKIDQIHEIISGVLEFWK